MRILSPSLAETLSPPATHVNIDFPGKQWENTVRKIVLGTDDPSCPPEPLRENTDTTPPLPPRWLD